MTLRQLFRIRRAMAVPLPRKMMFCEAFLRVCAAWFMIRILPYRFWRSRLGKLGSVGKPDPVSPSALVVVEDVAWAHQSLERAFGTRLTCLMLALSARDMLACRGVGSDLILGVARNTSDGSSGRLGAHAWVRWGDRYIVGFAGSERFTPVAIYRL